MPPKLEHLLALCAGKHGGRIVCTKDLHYMQVAEARSRDYMWVDEDGNGFVFLPWELTTEKDRERELKVS